MARPPPTTSEAIGRATAASAANTTSAPLARSPMRIVSLISERVATRCTTRVSRRRVECARLEMVELLLLSRAPLLIRSVGCAASDLLTHLVAPGTPIHTSCAAGADPAVGLASANGSDGLATNRSFAAAFAMPLPTATPGGPLAAFQRRFRPLAATPDEMERSPTSAAEMWITPESGRDEGSRDRAGNSSSDEKVEDGTEPLEVARGGVGTAAAQHQQQQLASAEPGAQPELHAHMTQSDSVASQPEAHAYMSQAEFRRSGIGRRGVQIVVQHDPQIDRALPEKMRGASPTLPAPPPAQRISARERAV